MPGVYRIQIADGAGANDTIYSFVVQKESDKDAMDEAREFFGGLTVEIERHDEKARKWERIDGPTGLHDLATIYTDKQ